MLRRSCFSPIFSASLIQSHRSRSESAVSAPTSSGKFNQSALGFTSTSSSSSFLIAFSKEYRHNVTDAFIPSRTLLRQSTYTTSIYDQLTELASRAKIEQFVPSDCIDHTTGHIIASRLIVSTAFDDRAGGKNNSHNNVAASSAKHSSNNNNNSQQQHGNKTGVILQTKQDKNSELVAHTRRLAVEHFNWSYYWRSLAFDNQDEAAEKFCSVLSAQDHSFFLTENSKLESSASGSSSNSKASELSKLEESIKKHLKLYATEGGAVSQGGSWTWLVWNPFTKTKFSSVNRYGLEQQKQQQQQPQLVETPTTPTAPEVKPTGEAIAETKSDEKKPQAVAATTSTNATGSTVFDVPSGGRLEVINTPFDVCPLELGLFPILCVNMTQRATLASPEEWATVPLGDANFAENKIPAWSRAARNPAAIKARAADLRKPGYQAFEPAEVQRQRFAEGVVDHLNWTTATQQLEKAIEWNSSKQRKEQMLQNAMLIRKRAEAKAQGILDRKISGTDSSSKNNNNNETPEQMQQQHQQQQENVSSTQQQAQQDESSSIKSANTVEEKINDVAVEQEEAPEETISTSSSSSENQQKSSEQQQKLTPDEREEAALTPTVSDDGNLVFQMADGRTRFKYPDGSVTITFPDGHRVKTEWHHSEDSVKANQLVFTRENTDGSYEYHYSNGSWTKTGVDANTNETYQHNFAADGTKL